MKPVNIIGMGMGPQDLTDEHLKIIKQSDILIGGNRLLNYFKDLKVQKKTIGRNIEEVIEFVMPGKKERLAILKSNIASFPIEIDSSFNIRSLVEKTEGMSGRDLVEKILKNALHSAILEGSKVMERHFEESLKKIAPLKIGGNSDERMYE